MKTPGEFEAFRAEITLARISLSSPRAHSAMEKFKDGTPAKQCVEEAIQHEANARNMWIATTLDPWCERHGITRKQGLSIASKDDAYNPADPSKDLVTLKSLFGWGGQQNDFFAYLNDEVNEQITAKVVVLVSGGVVQYASSNIPLCLIVHDEDNLSEQITAEEQTKLLDKVADGCTQISTHDSLTFEERASTAPSEVQQG